VTEQAAAQKAPIAARIEAAREYFTLKSTEARAAAIPADARVSMGKSLALARQRRAAAEVLWLAGETAEALRLAREGFVLAYDASEPANVRDESLRALKSKVDETKIPGLDDELTDPHSKLFESLIAGHDAIAGKATTLALDAKGIARTRTNRIVVASLATIAFVVLAWLVLHTPKTVRPEASSSYGDKFPPANAVDGRNETEWLLPDRTPGWLDLWLGPPRKVKALKVLNAHNGPYDDRATKEWHVEVYAKGGKSVKQIDGAFPEFSNDPQAVIIPVDADDVERVRFEVRGFHRTGGGLAEIEVQ
jgi:hypothetical protein